MTLLSDDARANRPVYWYFLAFDVMVFVLSSTSDVRLIETSAIGIHIRGKWLQFSYSAELLLTVSRWDWDRNNWQQT